MEGKAYSCSTSGQFIAPAGFIQAILSESTLAGSAMRRRGASMFGNALPQSARSGRAEVLTQFVDLIRVVGQGSTGESSQI
ncbi:uncharacterized protein BJX67DRAFT_362323 [Aspergillus lucknowensis]|uniref:Uncharacterized protein n=1 Tax=Aspergillus lucknowensis TaxID=176173 RepID=A0ABR4LHN1_9EURO